MCIDWKYDGGSANDAQQSVASIARTLVGLDINFTVHFKPMQCLERDCKV